MNTSTNAVPEVKVHSPALAPASLPATRLMYWSIRRELWENRSIYIAPLAAAGVYLLGFLIGLFWVPAAMHAMVPPHSSPPFIELVMPYAHASMLLMLTGFLVAMFYCLDALHGERRDRSILFWKSLPVSDLTTVLSKACIPFVVLPVVVFVTTVALQIAMRLVNTAALLLSGHSAAKEWSLPLFEMQLVTLYALAVLALWYAPIYCWFLLVSGWARRAAFLWALLPPIVLGTFELIAFRTTYIGLMMQNRVFGFPAAAFDLTDKNGVPVDAHFIPLAQLAPGRFLSNPSLWIGLVVAAAFLFAAVRLRRYRGPL